MTDTFSKQQRHEAMSKIRSKDTEIEIQVRHWLYHHGIRYRKNCKDIAGTPDIAIKKYKTAIFIHGCFWHGHENCKNFRYPKTNPEFWRKKIESNVLRDSNSINLLTKSGWNVYVLWECQISSDFDKTMSNLLADIMKTMRERQA